MNWPSCVRHELLKQRPVFMQGISVQVFVNPSYLVNRAYFSTV